MRVALSAFPASLLALAAPAAAQQFQHAVGALPGSPQWSSGVEAADVDNDGDLDLFFADGEGLASAGAKRQNRLVINLLESVPGTWSDESVARLGTHLTNAKGVAVGDIQGDGWVDAVFANAYRTDPPSLYVNRGASQPGFFDFDGAARGLTGSWSSAGAAFGDVDNDGDLDLVLTDSGADFLAGAGGKPHLMLNDGNGNFTEAGPAQGWDPAAKKAQMDARLVDVDRDLDLDYVGTNASANAGGEHYLLLNDGSGTFTDSSGLLPATSTQVYESELADLDKDTDVDLFLVNLSVLAEGPIENRLVPSGSLTFQNGTASEMGFDHEVAFLDYDLDSDLDVIVGSNSNQEKVFRNTGSLTFGLVGAVVEPVEDPTLDLALADVDNDGAVDLVTAQGELAAADWENKVYMNTGGADVLAPTVLAEEELGSPPSNGPWTLRVAVQDQAVDDGRTWVTGRADYVVNKTPKVAFVTMAGFDFLPQDIVVEVGTTVVWDNPTFMNHTVSSSTPGYPFNSGDMGFGDTFQYTFVNPGVYDYFCAPHVGLGMVGTVTVTGPAPAFATAVDSGGGILRFQMNDTAFAKGVELAWELHLFDRVGNERVVDGKRVPLTPFCGAVQYGLNHGGANVLGLAAGGGTGIGQTLDLITTNVVDIGCFTTLAVGRGEYPFYGGTFLINPFALVFTWIVPATAGTAVLSVPLPDDPSLAGGFLHFQSAAFDGGQVQGAAFSNGLELIVCP